MSDYAEHSVAIHRLIKEADQCYRDKLFPATRVELEELIAHARMAIEHCFSKDAE